MWEEAAPLADVAADFGMVVIDSDELGGVKTCPKTTCDQMCNAYHGFAILFQN